MEITAAIKALEALKRPSDVTIYTDSKYLQNGMTLWIKGWKKKWQKVGKELSDIKNVDLWIELDKLAQLHNVKWEWVRGHSGNPGNERADQLAEIGRITIHKDIKVKRKCHA